MKIGEVARQAGVGVDTVRFYERRGVLPLAPRRVSGYRLFTAAAVERIQFAKLLQALGFTLTDVVEMLRAVDAGGASCASEQHRIAAVLARIDDQLAALGAVRQRLVDTRRRCRNGSCNLLSNAGSAQRSGGELP